MEIVSKVSRGSKMDQIYLPKNRAGFSAGSYVLVTSLESRLQNKTIKPYFYKTDKLEPIKIKIIEEIFNLLERLNPENMIITGSFLESGFNFNDIDILVIQEKAETADIPENIENLTGIKPHVISLNSKTLLSGLASDPIYSMMLSKFVSKKRVIFSVERKINPQFLDLHLLKSKNLPENFDILNGSEKYYLTLNMLSILLFIQGKKLNKDIVNKEIEKMFGVKIIAIKDNLIDKQRFTRKYKEIYDKTFNLILQELENEQK